MNRFIHLTLGLALLLFVGCSTCSIAQEAQDPEVRALPSIVYTPEPVVIDGVLDEPCWQSAVAIRADYTHGRETVLSPDARMLVKYAWDEHYFYLAYETFDDDLVARGQDTFQGPAGNRRQGAAIWDPVVPVDVVEFFISFGSLHFFWEIHHNALNQFNDVWITVVDPGQPIASSIQYGIHFAHEEFIQDELSYTFRSAVQLKPGQDGGVSTVNASDDRDTGYTAEIRLPWAGIMAPLAARSVVRDEDGKTVIDSSWNMAGREMRVLAVVQNGGLKQRYHHSSPLGIPSWFHQSAANWPVYLLDENVKEGTANE